MQKHQRITRELSKMQTSPPRGIAVSSKDDTLSILEAQIIGPEGSPYDTGLFKLEILIPDKYPFSPPSMRFITKVYHPNIDENGRICMDLIKMPPRGSWRPTIGLEGLLIAVRMLLEHPNPDDPLMVDVADEYQRDRAKYVEKAKEFTKKYAC